MENETESLSFGRYLRAIRLDKKISLEQVADQTRIGRGNLMLIEQEDHDQLPAAVFVKGFLRAYAAAIGADGDEAVRRYESQGGVDQISATSKLSTAKPNSRTGWKLIFSLGLLLCIIALSIVAITFLRPQPGGGNLSHQSETAGREQTVEKDGQKGTISSVESGKAALEKLTLQIIAIEKSWIKVIADEKESAEYQLNSGDEIELEARTGFNLLIGDARALKITLNDKYVSVPGESGQMVNLHLP